jgi:N-acetylneuraminate lyase
MKFTNNKIAGIFPALVTPLAEDGSVNIEALEKLLDRAFRAGCDGVYLCGSTGEGTLLDEASRRQIVETAMQNVPHGKHVIVHVGAWSLDVSEDLAKHAERCQASAISCIRPQMVNHAEMLAWYTALASCTDLPFLAYYFPASIGEPLDVDQLSEICEMPGVAGIKYTDYDLYTLSLLTRSGYRIFNGRDEVLAAGLLMGACGGIGSVYNLVPEWFVELYRHAEAGDWSAVRALQDRINDLMRVLLRFPFLPALKQILTWEGIDCGSVVRPRTGLTAAQELDLRNSLATLQIFQCV